MNNTLRQVINRSVRHMIKSHKWGQNRIDVYLSKLGIQKFSMNQLVVNLNKNGFKEDQVVVKTNMGYIDGPDDDWKPQGIVFLVMDSELATKIATLGFIPGSEEIF